jgi:tetratricopeptide (TPR) repeat protein
MSEKKKHPITPPVASPPSSWISLMWVALVAMGGVFGAAAWLFWPASMSTPITAPVVRPEIPPFQMEDQTKTFAQYAGSSSCKSCHEDAYAKWAQSNHGMAERPLRDDLDLAAFDPAHRFKHGTQTTETRKTKDQYEIVSLGFEGKMQVYPVDRVIGHDPLRQFLIKGEKGRFHTLEACWDPHKGEWFNVYGDEDRRPGEWGHWTGRGMGWNQMCASCHNTRVRKNYDLKTDTYQTAMAETTVSCESCHGGMKSHMDWQQAHPKSETKDPTVIKFNRDQTIETCAPCHARRGEITGDFKPGDSFADHYSLTIVDHTDIYHADGQIRDENYEFGSFHSSRMFHAGVRCVDCHDPHAAKPILPGNTLCMRCHTAGGFPSAPTILPEAHSFHQADSTGNQCVNCHMPQTVYMQRHSRHDHGFTIPDPLLTKQFNIPNACNKCHTDKDVNWALEAVEKTHGDKMNRRTRTRAQTFAKARAGDASARDELLALLDSDEIPHWKASAVLLLDRWIQEPQVLSAVQAQTEHADPLVRASAARILEAPLASGRGDLRAALQSLLEDPARSVRVAAAWTLRDHLDMESAAGKDLFHMIELNADQPNGQMQMAQFRFARQETAEAIRHMETAIEWDPNSPPFHHDLAMMYSMAGNSAKAIEKLQDAIRLAPKEAEYHYKLGLAFSESGDMPKTIAALEAAVKADPRYARAWYNLGLARNQARQTESALDALSKGEQADPRDPGIPYARATILAQLGRKSEATEALHRVLLIQPDHAEARQLLGAMLR